MLHVYYYISIRKKGLLFFYQNKKRGRGLQTQMALPSLNIGSFVKQVPSNTQCYYVINHLDLEYNLNQQHMEVD